MIFLRFVLTAVLLAGLLAGCTRGAPDLPPDTSSVNAERQLSEADFSSEDLSLTCADLYREQDAIAAEAETYNASIEGNRQKNQVAGYIAGVVFLPAIVATEHNDAEKADLDRLQERFDLVQGLKRIKNC